MATVNLAACKIAGDALRPEPLADARSPWGCLNVVFAAHSGLWGVLVIDMIQFFIKMTAVIAAAYFAVTLPQVGGLSGLVEKLSTRCTARAGSTTWPCCRTSPTTGTWPWRSSSCRMAVQWWAVWYPGAEPGGGSYIAQRMLASKSEKDALGGVLFFNLAHYVLRPWPWILVGAGVARSSTPSCRTSRRPSRTSIRSSSATTSPIPAMLRFLPVGWMGLMVGGLIAANSSTILTHLNWGASYLVHDFYRRFIRPASHREALRLRGTRRDRHAVRLLVRDGLSCSRRRRTTSTSSSRSAPERGCSTWSAGSGGGSTPGARSWP